MDIQINVNKEISMNESNPNWYRIDNINELDSPVLVVYPDRVKANINTAVSMVDDVLRLRPHIKTSKCLETIQLMMAAGIQKFKCATIAEAEALGICRAPDVLLAYQPNGPKLQRFVNVIKKYPATKYSCLADNMHAAQEMAAAFELNGLQVPVYIDLNIGMNRTGIAPGNDVVELYKFCDELKGIQPVGLHAYDGHIRDIDFTERTKKCDEAFSIVAILQKDLTLRGFSKPVIIMGGSPTFSVHCKRNEIECSPGTFVYWDKGYTDLCPEQNFLTAALVISRVISLPTAARICTDLGHKSIAAENELTRRIYFLNAPSLQPISHSEEHLVLEAGEGHGFKTGDVLYGLPIHICPTVALYEKAITIENGKTSGEWKTIARDRRIEV
ncbi:MAG: D-TA family PLP-dependent enzyme [Bacteroidota bacterium]